MTSLRLIFLLFPCCDRSCLLLRLARRLCWRMVEQRLVPSRRCRFLAWSFVVVRRLRQHAYSSRRLSLGELSLLCERPCVAHCYTGSLPFARRVCVVPSPLHVSSKRFSVHFDILPWRCAVCFGCSLRLCVLQRLSHCGCPLSTSSSLFSDHRLPLLLRPVLMSAHASVPLAVRPFWVVLLHAEVQKSPQTSADGSAGETARVHLAPCACAAGRRRSRSFLRSLDFTTLPTQAQTALLLRDANPKEPY